jgi:hypothetical protein
MMGDNSTYISVGGEDTDTEPPVVSNLVLNGNSDINLTENTTTTIQWTATITDTDGNTDIASADGYLFRSGVATGGTCTPSNNNCYYDSSCALSSCAGNSCTATCSVDVYFHAEPTDAGTYSAQSWQASVTATDDAALTGSGTSSAGVTELLSLIALNVTSSINYGSLTPGANSGATNQSTTVTNTGNVPIDGEISGSAMCIDYPVCAGITIPVGSQEYATSTFTYGAGTDLTGSATIIQLNLAKPTSSPSTSTGTIYWGIGIPSPLETGAYSGQNVLLADQE